MMESSPRFSVSFSLRLKITLTFLLVGGIVSGLLSYSMYRILDRRLFAELQNRVMALTKLGADLVDGDTLARLAARVGAEMTDEQAAAAEASTDFRKVSDALNSVRAVEPEIVRFVYTFRPTENPNMARYLVDADVLKVGQTLNGRTISTDDVSHFASDFDVSDFPMARRALAERAALTEKEYSYDKEFRVNSLSGYAPIFARGGRTLVAMIGVDMVDTDARAVLAGATRLATIIIIAALVLTLASSILLGTLFTRGIISLDQVVRKFGKDNLGLRAKVKSRDEVGRLSHSFNAMAETVQGYSVQLEQLLSALRRFVPREFITLLKKGSIVDVKLGDQIQQEMSILFSDIRSFTELSESMTPEENFNFLNSYLSRIGPEIRRNGGFIDKYIGDAIMALFPGDPDEALRAAIGMQRKVEEYNGHRAKTGYKPINIGIGVHTGSLMLGTLGELERMDGSVISDAVNLASRLEGLTRVYGASVLTTSQTVRSLKTPGDFRFRLIDRVRVKGRRENVMLFEVLDGDSAEDRVKKLAYRNELAQALRDYYGRRFGDALPVFESLRERNTADRVLGIFAKRCKLLAELGAPDDWQGVELLEIK
jgi:class 3 adenylate cyclase/HAMP domain-containing protein